MEPPIDRIHLSQTAKDQLIKLKRGTKIDQWNILCRWAFCRSLAEPTIPSPVPIPADSNVEMTWRVFGGKMSDMLLIALKQRCHNDNLGTERGNPRHTISPSPASRHWLSSWRSKY
jgi:DNA sulfur modification protein DndE